ncbi:two-component system activity regulator YycH [Saccharibacillus sp. CPCC 101409]|uniref:YycH family regulatory protein n=1 Tax=Saccharibacillus sp. CPCC 101409 TaxID=3058041 RepID=UPI00267165BC|nr:two-component system activity regulator YycH [Saccharibacillus sp. CPCC 101409]MDO3409686.1 two-component system activity regulator YycH [Saccharibacillus sp. CPCC 101409]
MKERLKTAALTLLVAVSLVQSYLLIYRLPGTGPVAVSSAGYVRTDEMGEQKSVEDTLYPDRMVIHMGKDRHTVFYPDSAFYKLIYARIQARDFAAFQVQPSGGTDWEKIAENNSGIELSFGTGLPVPLLQKTMRLAADPAFETTSIDRIWIYTGSGDEKPRAFFFSSNGKDVYEATQIDLTVQDVLQHVAFGAEWTPYTALKKHTLYIPSKPIVLAEAVLDTASFTSDQMQRNLFADPAVTRNIHEQDGSDIYTDSKRSLQVEDEGRWMTYTDPAAVPAIRADATESVLSAVDFINQHGGWNGSYRAVLPSGESKLDDDLNLRFQQYYGSLPILGSGTVRYGYMNLILQQGTVSFYERSLMETTEESEQGPQYTLSGGQELIDRIAKVEEVHGLKVVSLYPAYTPRMNGETLRLVPGWAAEMSDGTTVTFN